MRCLVAALLVVGIAACGGSAVSPAPNPATARVGVMKAYDTLLDFADPSLNPKVADIQDGPAIRTSLRQALAMPEAKLSAGAQVQEVTILDATRCTSRMVPVPCARVTYSVVSPASIPPGVNEVMGFATYNGKWLVAKVTVCRLLRLLWQEVKRSEPPAGC